MTYGVLQYLEESADRFPEKTAVVDEYGTYCYRELREKSRHIGGALTALTDPGRPVAVYREKSAETLMAFFGIVYAGGCYSLLNPELPDTRLQQIAAVLQPVVVITEEERTEKARALFPTAAVITVAQLLARPTDEPSLRQRNRERLDTDPLYINFTSGSTGVPKGIAVCHRSVLDFIGVFTELFALSGEDRLANQAPFDFDVSVKDIYAALKTGATLVLVPRRLFSAPTQLIDFLCEQRVTTLIWAVSALCLISTFHGLDYKTPDTINKVLFSGEVMPYKHLRTWREHLPDARFVNLYGPTEITCNCTYHELDPARDYADGIPIGRPFPNEGVFLLDERNRKITEPETVGELCVRGTALALGYYGNAEQSAAHFVQNPLNPHYPERIYRTGDLARYNGQGELVFSGRKDFQIKYLGHRIELEEIERAMAAIDGVERCCCLFDEKRARLKGYYVGTLEKEALHEAMKRDLPAFMIPGQLRRVEVMPLTKNGKIDRRALEEMGGKVR